MFLYKECIEELAGIQTDRAMASTHSWLGTHQHGQTTNQDVLSHPCHPEHIQVTINLYTSVVQYCACTGTLMMMQRLTSLSSRCLKAEVVDDSAMMLAAIQAQVPQFQGQCGCRHGLVCTEYQLSSGSKG